MLRFSIMRDKIPSRLQDLKTLSSLTESYKKMALADFLLTHVTIFYYLSEYFQIFYNFLQTIIVFTQKFWLSSYYTILNSTVNNGVSIKHKWNLI